jgi:UDPglucose--hexose-1-phosphate uridylyltransferase
VGGDESGAHEVVIDSPRHIQNTGDLTPQELAGVLEAYNARLGHWYRDGRFGYATIFKNVHATAGASLVHLHSQLMVLPEAPPPFLRELSQLDHFRREHGQCALCEWIARERSNPVRLVLDRDGYVAICPYVSLHAYETWVLPVDHDCWFPPARNRVSTHTLASVLWEVVSRVERMLPGIGYNMIVRIAPWDAPMTGYHPRIEIRPRLDALAGFELGSGIHVNQVSPEYAAQKLRALEPHWFCGA